MTAGSSTGVSEEKFYEAIIEQNQLRERSFCELRDEMNQMEIRLMKELKLINGHTNQIADNKEEIDRLRARSDRWDGIIGLGSLFLTIIRYFIPVPWDIDR